MFEPPKQRINRHTTGYHTQQFLPGGLANNFVCPIKKTTVFHNLMFTDAYNNNWLDSLAIYLMLFKKFDNKNFFFYHEQKNKGLQELAAQLGVSKNTLISKMKVLKEKGLLSVYDIKIRNVAVATRYYLASNKDISKKYNCIKFGLYVNMNNVSTYKDLKYFLKNIPFLSNLSVQKNKYKHHSHFSTLRQEIDNGQSVDYKSYKALLKYENSLRKDKKTKVQNKGLLPNLSLKGILRVTNKKSSTTASRYKNFLIDRDVISTFKRSRKLCDVESKEHFEYLKYESKSIPKHSLYSKQSNIAYVYDSSLFFITSDKWSMDMMEDYYDENLRDYVEGIISERNCFLDMQRNAYKKKLGVLSIADRDELSTKHGPEANIVSDKMYDKLCQGYSNASLWFGCRINYNKTERVGRGRDNCTFTKSYSFSGPLINSY